MRKPSKIVPTRMPAVMLAVVALLALPGCQKKDADSDAAHQATDGQQGVDSSTGRTGAAAIGGGSVAGSPLRMDPVMADQPMAAPAMEVMPQNAAKSMARDASIGLGVAGSRGDLSLGTPIPSIDATGAMLVRHGQASIEVRGVDAAVLSVRKAASKLGGFVANTSLRSGKDEQRSATIELRVPSDRFDALLSELGQLGKVESVTASAQDVAEEYVDLGARAANARKVEARLIEMLATRTGKLSDVLTVEQELARVRMEAERYEARIRYLERRSSLSSLDITIHEPLKLIEPQPGPGPIAQALADAWANMVGVAAWCVATLGLLVPVAILIGTMAVLLRRLWRGGGPREA